MRSQTDVYLEWMKFIRSASWLALESHQVIALRVIKLSRGGAPASREAARMIEEKIIALGEASAKVASGCSPDSVLSGYRRKVRANRRRLMR